MASSDTKYEFGSRSDDVTGARGSGVDVKGTAPKISEDEYLKGLTEADQAEMKAIFQVILDLNGAQSDIVSGQPKTYIDKEAYFCHVIAEDGDAKKKFTESQVDIISQVYNWKACGKGKMGLFGALLRKELRTFFQLTRETRIIRMKGTGLTEEFKTDLKAYTEVLKKNNVLAAIISKNAKSFAAQAGINLFTKMHHWDAKNQREWQALFAAIGVSEELAGEDLRPMVYLALHPLPLMVSSKFRKAAAGVDQTFNLTHTVKGDDATAVFIEAKGFVNSVSIRAKAIPAGCATFAVCAAAWNSLIAENYGAKLSDYVARITAVPFADYKSMVTDLQHNGEAYHPMAREFGSELKILDTSKVKMYMDVAAAYIYETLKGTLARSAALNKYKDQNARVINLWQVRFRLEKQSEKDSVTAFLTATEKKQPTPAARLAAISSEASVQEAVNDYMLSGVKAKVKALDQIREIEAAGVSVADYLPMSERTV